ncbi:MAG: diguanylate cyclase [Nitrospirae bacterium]|nr:diguanylate cyclase [Nitrospirota bacterium]
MTQHYRILIVDDEDAIKGLLTAFFASMGHHCDTASDGVEALKMIYEADYDTVITDIKMPNMDGIVLTKNMLKRQPGLSVIVMTGFAADNSEEDAIEAGAGDFITKPFTLPELSARFNRLMRDHKLNRELQDLAHLDILTGLPNRARCMDRLAQALEMAKRYKHMLAVLFLDLDRFKEINDTFGHDTGDLLLKEAADRLTSCVRKADTVARLGGDEFVVVLARVAEAKEAASVSERIINALSLPFQIGAQECSIGVSIGISIFPADSGCADELIKKADKAMYYAKKHDKNKYCHYSELPAD